MDMNELVIKSGAHNSPDEGMCVMEAVAYVAGEPHSDRPECACPVIASFLRSWNDGLPDDETRTRLLSEFVTLLPGTRSTTGVELRRAEMALDWLVREQLPLALELTPGLAQYALQLRGLPEVAAAAMTDTVPILNAAESAARRAAESAARSAAWSAAWSAAESAASLLVSSAQESAVTLIHRMISVCDPCMEMDSDSVE